MVHRDQAKKLFFPSKFADNIQQCSSAPEILMLNLIHIYSILFACCLGLLGPSKLAKLTTTKVALVDFGSI